MDLVIIFFLIVYFVCISLIFITWVLHSIFFFLPCLSSLPLFFAFVPSAFHSRIEGRSWYGFISSSYPPPHPALLLSATVSIHGAQSTCRACQI